MSYCTEADIKSLLIPETILAQLTDDSAGTTVDSAKVTDAITKADALIDGSLRYKYSGELPLSPIPELIESLSIAIAAYYLYRRRHDHEGIPEPITEGYKDAKETLKLIRKGELDPGILAAGTNVGQSYRTNKVAADRIFDEDKMDNFYSGPDTD